MPDQADTGHRVRLGFGGRRATEKVLYVKVLAAWQQKKQREAGPTWLGWFSLSSRCCFFRIE
jgi:hypothetical protein